MKEDISSLLKLPIPELVSLANRVRQRHTGLRIELCSILNAKSGRCGEDCKFCAQASRHSGEILAYPLKGKEEILKSAQDAKDIGADKFGIVTSGNRLSKKELDAVAEAIFEIRSNVGIAVCASLGTLNEEELKILKESGLSRYHHNIETSARFYPQIVTTHTFEERLHTIRAAKRAGLEVCSGGIIGMGETWQDRIDMAHLLKGLDVDSVPINILVPIRGTPLEDLSPLSCVEAIRTIALFRIILKDKVIKIAAGRESMLKDFQALGFMAGANGMLIGGYLTIKGRDVKEDWKLVEDIEMIWKE